MEGLELCEDDFRSICQRMFWLDLSSVGALCHAEFGMRLMQVNSSG